MKPVYEMTRSELMANLPPLPWKLEDSATVTNNGNGHLYLVDATGKKIAALWGTQASKAALGEFILEQANEE